MPRVFISYSYDSAEHKIWVLDFATRLRSDGVETILDRWELEPGDQLPEFMERAVQENDYVLIVCTPRYKERSDNRTGGVGFEEDIMTAEVLSERNRRKFKPILRAGEWDNAAPRWLRGSVHIDLRGDPYAEDQYAELLMSLLGTRPKAPPVKKPSAGMLAAPTFVAPATADESAKAFEPVKIVGVIEGEIGHPRNDGTPGCALYEVPFRFSRRPPSEWAQLFIQSWNSPRRFTSMHRPGIARISGDRLVLDGTTLEEVERWHRDTLKLSEEDANKTFAEFLAKKQQQQERERRTREEHERTAREAVKRIRFD